MIDEQLKQAIVDSGKTAYAIAREAGLRPEQVARFVTGKRDLTLSTAARVAAVLGLALGVPAKRRDPAKKSAKGPKRKRADTALGLAMKETGWKVSEPTARKSIAVVNKIDELTASGQQEQAERLRHALNNGSVSAAWRLMKTL